MPKSKRRKRKRQIVEDGVLGTLYLLCFEPQYVGGTKTAKHYLGWTEKESAEERLHEHLTGNGNPLVRAAHKAGCEIRMVKTWSGTRAEERRAKKHGHLAELCPFCTAKEAEKRKATRRRHFVFNREKINRQHRESRAKRAALRSNAQAA